MVLVSALAIAAPDGLELVDQLGSQDRHEVETAVAAIEHAGKGTPDLADALFAAARTCEDTLADPARALALYDRLLREYPDARVVMAAGRRAEVLRAQLGAGGEHAARATELAKLISEANQLPADEIIRRGDALANAPWPGAPDATLWLAEWLRRAGRLDEARARYASITARWPGTRYALTAIRNGAGCAIEAHDWDRAEALAAQLPALEPADRIMRDTLLDSVTSGRLRDRWYLIAWIVAAFAIAALAASLLETALHGGRRRPILRPPVEVMFLAPVGAVLVGVAFTAHRLIAPAVTALAIGGVVLAWLSGATLDTLRDRGRPVKLRAMLHIILSILAVAAIGYIVLTRDNLIDMVIETAQFGPEP